MSKFNPDKLAVKFIHQATPEGPLYPRYYTLTHSDATGDLYLTIGTEIDRQQVSGLYTRLMRDEVLANWEPLEGGPVLNVHCHVSGGLVFGSASWRYSIFRRHLRMVLEAFRYGDDMLFLSYPELDQAPIQVRFYARQPRYNRTEHWGVFEAYHWEEFVLEE